CHQVFEEKPQIIILTSLIENNKVIYTPGDICLKNNLESHSGYKLTSVFSTTGYGSTYRYEMFTNF
ncbi:MAG: protein LphB, partial [bacterium]|nr:protein LphB [bacterium]